MKEIKTWDELKKVISKYYCYATDYDGTIIDSMPTWYHFASRYVESKGLTPKPGLDDSIKYKSNIDAARKIYEDYHILQNAAEVCEDINKFMFDVYPTLPLKKNSLELLKLLSISGRNLLSSATPEVLLVPSAKAQQIIGYYKDIYSASDLDRSKESGALFKYILREESICRDQLLVIEDSITAMKICKKMKIDTLIVADYSNKNDMKDIKKYATYYADITNLV